MTTRVLSTHAGYGCRESGACCTSGWPIPIEPDRLANARQAIDAGIVRPRRGRKHTLARLPGPGTPALLPVADGACLFYREAGPARCAIHQGLGHAALPLACRQFPRVVVIDPRGVSVTLSHYCPTAAGLLERDVPVCIVADAAGFPPDGEYVGLDVREALPPALRPDMLMDWEAWWLWEAEAVAWLGSHADSREALARMALAVEAARGWSPGADPLAARVSAAFAMARTSPRATWTPRAFDDVASGIVAATPSEFQPQAEQVLARRGAATSARAHAAFLAAHAFANWTAHLGEDLRTWFHSIAAAHSLIAGGLSVRDADLLLRHLVDPRLQVRRGRQVRRARGT